MAGMFESADAAAAAAGESRANSLRFGTEGSSFRSDTV
jgi:hypothetical protein